MAIEKQISLLACLFLLGLIVNATDTDNDKIWEKFKELEEKNEKLERELHEKNSYMSSLLQGAMNDIHEVKEAQSQREMCKYCIITNKRKTATCS